MSVLQKLQDSEINFRISCFFDNQWLVELGDEVNGYKENCYAWSFADAEAGLIGLSKKHYPDSDFAGSHTEPTDLTPDAAYVAGLEAAARDQRDVTVKAMTLLMGYGRIGLLVANQLHAADDALRAALAAKPQAAPVRVATIEQFERWEKAMEAHKARVLAANPDTRVVTVKMLEQYEAIFLLRSCNGAAAEIRAIIAGQPAPEEGM